MRSSKFLRPLLAGLICLAAPLAAQSPIRTNGGFGTASLPKTDDAASPVQTLGFTMNFFGRQYTTIFVNENGNVSFEAPLTEEYSPIAFSDVRPGGNVSLPIIAPYWADADNSAAADSSITYGRDTVNGRPAFGVTWNRVGYYDRKTDKRNTFQLVIIDRGDTGAGNFDVEFNYGQIQWETGDATDGSGQNGLGGQSAAAGYANGTGDANTFFQVDGSLRANSFLDSSSTALIRRTLNAGGQLGRLVLQARAGSVTTFGITGVSPENIMQSSTLNGGAFTLSVAGSSFPTNATVQWNGANLTTRFVSSGLLTASVPANLIGAVGTAQVRVVSGATSSAPRTVNINPQSQTDLRPTLAAVRNGAGFDPASPIAPGSWATAFGSNFATNMGVFPNNFRQWFDNEIINGTLPSSLDGVSVTVGGLPAAVYVISSTQINFQVPAVSTFGNAIPVVVTTPFGTSTLGVNVQQVAPGVFTNDGGGQRFVAAINLQGQTIADPTVFPGTVRTRVGDVIQIFGTGMGPTNPVRPTGLVIQTAVLTNRPTVTIGGVEAPLVSDPANVGFLVGAGLNQVNVRVPQVAVGNQPIRITIGGVSTPTGIVVAVGN